MLRRRTVVVFLVASVSGLSCVSAAQATTRLVGPGHPYAKPCQAIAASAAGDTVQIDAAGNGTYDGDVCATSVPNLTIEGVNGRAHIDAAGHSSGGKAIWVISGANTVVRNVELSGAAVPDKNGAAIRLEGGGDLTLVGCYLHDNEDGILTSSDPASDVTIDSTELADNGAGDGQSHNIYVGNIHSFTMRDSWSHDAKVGHLVKSRAAINDILYNRLTGEDGTDSYELDLPNGGLTHVLGNVIEQGPNTQNPAMLAYGEEGATNPDSQLTVVNNTFVNDRPGNATAIFVAGSVSAPAQVANNISVGASTFVTQAAAQLKANCLVADPRFVDRAAYDYHLQATSPCRDVATPTPAGGLPSQQYVYNLGLEARAVVGAAPDAGAFEWGSAPAPATPGATTPTPAPGASGGGSSQPAAPATPTATLSVIGTSVRKDGRIRLTIAVPGGGRLTARATAKSGKRRVTYGRATAKRRAAGRVTVTVKPTKAGKRALRYHRKLAVTITLTFTPAAGGKALRKTTHLKLRATRTGVRRG